MRGNPHYPPEFGSTHLDRARRRRAETKSPKMSALMVCGLINDLHASYDSEAPITLVPAAPRSQKRRSTLTPALAITCGASPPGTAVAVCSGERYHDVRSTPDLYLRRRACAHRVRGCRAQRRGPLNAAFNQIDADYECLKATWPASLRPAVQLRSSSSISFDRGTIRNDRRGSSHQAIPQKPLRPKPGTG
jgi:hypothetical protein